MAATRGGRMLQQIDIRARRRAAELLEAYLADEMTGREVAGGWPASRIDPALEGIGAEMLPEIGPDRMSEDFAADRRRELRTVLGRCRSFLLSEHPYAWGRLGAPGCARFMLGWGIALLVLLTLAEALTEQWYAAAATAAAALLLTGLYLNLRRPPRRIQSMLKGELAHWPFERPEDVPTDAEASGRLGE